MDRQRFSSNVSRGRFREALLPPTGGSTSRCGPDTLPGTAELSFSKVFGDRAKPWSSIGHTAGTNTLPVTLSAEAHNQPHREWEP
ncbi:hypothetical protein C5O27_17675 [Gordonia alkanivorans]|nr:hypothetical protein C5O27_17675 [Gordonia alkanivorans]